MLDIWLRNTSACPRLAGLPAVHGMLHHSTAAEHDAVAPDTSDFSLHMHSTLLRFENTHLLLALTVLVASVH